MTQFERISRLKDLMNEQVEKINLLVVQEKLMQRALLEKDWTSLQSVILKIRDLSQLIAFVENARDCLYMSMRENLEIPESANFYDFLVKLPIEDRDELAVAYRNLKQAVGMVSSLTGGIDAYIGSTVSSMSKVLEELMPSRRLRLYGRNGVRKVRDQPLMVNTSL
jgi:hypothetical protein